MQYKEYGTTGKKLSVIGFGGMRFLKEDYDVSLEKSADVVIKAAELGINYFDTAPFYCDDKSEDIFGTAFKQLKKINTPFYVSTKSMLKSEPTADDVRRRIENSLRRLNVDRIDFFHMWCIIHMWQYEKIMAKGGPYEGAMKAKEEGLISHLVASTHLNGDDIETIVNDNVFEGLTLGYNIANFAFRRKGIEAAYKNGMGVVTMNPLGGGIIPKNSDFFSCIKNPDESMAVSGLKFNAGHKEITVTLAGMGTIDEVLENVKAGENIKEITGDYLDELSKQANSSNNSL